MIFHVLFWIAISIMWLGAGFNYALGLGAIYMFLDYHRARRIDHTPLEPKKVKHRIRK
jgi:hypothetical protein